MAAVAAISITAASAQTIKEGVVIRVAGSTAMRSVSMPAVDNYATVQGYKRVAADNASVGSQQIALYIKDSVVGRTVTRDAINVRLIGSEGGILTTAGTKPTHRQTFLNPAATNWNTNNPLAIVGPTNCTTLGFAAVTFADQAQPVSAYSSSPTARVKVASLGAGTPLAALNFAFFANTNFPASNITSQVAKALLANGNVPLSMFTGNSSDADQGVWITGRDWDSGTRAVTLLETGYGVTTTVKQYTVDGSNVVPSPAAAFFGLPVAVGNGGYASGGTLRSVVTNNALVFPTTPAYRVNHIIGYAGTPDVIAARAKALSYNGVAAYCPSDDVSTAQGFSTTANGVANGSYSYWSTAYLYTNPKNVATTGRTQLTAFANTIATAIQGASSAQLKNGNTKLSDLRVKRANGVAATVNPL